ncbi:DUF4153 domain-containing protein [Massilia sp. CFBP9026]|uniref:DUF4153 domain-containing protein n=1 Tax=Massilia sp. CFBP9026 TaxID=3096536 RepID=UPI002A6B3DF7|nr:DUF4153 domain-containing protein [Massilia sp. CFBP9026]MDY0962848.1 DUF4153 domain-containing protein [Massilia sp. CFBP9026]
MQQPAPAAAFPAPSPDDDLVPTWLGPTRIVIGLAQGLLLYLLYTAAQDKSWPATVPLLFGPLAMLGLLLPVILISGLGHLSRRQLTAWALSAAAVIALLAAYDMWRRLGGTSWEGGKPSGMLTFCLAVGFFIAHALVLAASREGRRIAAYASYFEVAWKLNLQILFCLVFVGATWMVLQLGAALFDLVKLNFLSQAIGKAWFFIPVTAFAFSVAMHLTDVKPAIVRGIRNLLHVLLSWILPVLTLLVGGFLASLPFTGLDPLWATRSAGGILLSAAAAFVVLINAAYQDGASPPARVLAIAARIACLLLVPLTLLAAYALALRVADHGWSADRVIAAASLLVAACYAGGYAAAALRRGWLRTLAGVNIAAAFVVLAVLALLLSPVLDPGRIAVNSQLARLASGQIALRQLDVAYLHHHGARHGRAALVQLEGSATGPDADWLRAELARLRQPRPLDADTPAQIERNLKVWPAGAALPAGFAQFDWKKVEAHYDLPLCLRSQQTPCDAYVIDLGGDARLEVIVVGAPDHGNAVLRQDDQGGWQIAGSLPASLTACAPMLDALRAGRVRAAPPPLADLDIGGRHVPLERSATRPDCAAMYGQAAEVSNAQEDAPR